MISATTLIPLILAMMITIWIYTHPVPHRNIVVSLPETSDGDEAIKEIAERMRLQFSRSSRLENFHKWFPKMRRELSIIFDLVDGPQDLSRALHDHFRYPMLKDPSESPVLLLFGADISVEDLKTPRESIQAFEKLQKASRCNSRKF
ncbi:hypothetical protein F5Y16DRAFT_425427 [Xylariaceae sp. FL0255]|nr:hypothetical protein F5Y16DRAFT_425427 [Xylariaceae sp. FL0255]